MSARLKNNDYRFHVTGMTMTYTQDGEAKTLDAELEILDAYRNVKAEFTMPSADARISFKVEEIYYVRVTSNAYGAVSADRIRARKGDMVNISATPNNTAKPYYKLYAAYEWDTATEQAEIINNNSFIMPAGSDVTVYAEYFDAVANYIERSWDGEKVVANECIRTPSEGYIKMSEVADSGTLQDGNWYYVDSNVTFSGRIHTDGEVHIILGDGATVDFKRGLEVSEGDTLNVYDQKQGTGKMIAFCERFAQRDDQDEAAIGGDKGLDGGSMNFYGGNFEATTKRETRGAAIGGSGFRAGGRMIFYAGNYTVKARFGSSTGIGGGNNGGDGYALACILTQNRYPCRIVKLSDKLTEDSAYFAKAAQTLGVPTQRYTDGAFTNADMIVDCLLGTGFLGTLREPFLSAVNEINRSKAQIVSVDINSGMNGDTGEAQTAVRSDVTVTIGYVKRGLIKNDAGSYMKKLVVADIGIVLAKHEDMICPADDLPKTDDSSLIPAPAYLETEPIDVSRATCPQIVEMG